MFLVIAAGGLQRQEADRANSLRSAFLAAIEIAASRRKRESQDGEVLVVDYVAKVQEGWPG